MRRTTTIEVPVREFYDYLDIPTNATDIDVEVPMTYAAQAIEYINVTYTVDDNPVKEQKMEVQNPGRIAVNQFLSDIGEETFNVGFWTKDGSERTYTGTQHPDTKIHNDYVVIMTPEGVKSFSKDRVFYIGEV